MEDKKRSETAIEALLLKAVFQYDAQPPGDRRNSSDTPEQYPQFLRHFSIF